MSEININENNINEINTDESDIEEINIDESNIVTNNNVPIMTAAPSNDLEPRYCYLGVYGDTWWSSDLFLHSYQSGALYVYRGTTSTLLYDIDMYNGTYTGYTPRSNWGGYLYITNGSGFEPCTPYQESSRFVYPTDTVFAYLRFYFGGSSKGDQKSFVTTTRGQHFVWSYDDSGVRDSATFIVQVIPSTCGSPDSYRYYDSLSVVCFGDLSSHAESSLKYFCNYYSPTQHLKVCDMCTFRNIGDGSVYINPGWYRLDSVYYIGEYDLKTTMNRYIPIYCTNYFKIRNISTTKDKKIKLKKSNGTIYEIGTVEKNSSSSFVLLPYDQYSIDYNDTFEIIFEDIDDSTNKIYINNEWKNANAYVYVNNEWKKCTGVYTWQNGKWNKTS